MGIVSRAMDTKLEREVALKGYCQVGARPQTQPQYNGASADIFTHILGSNRPAKPQLDGTVPRLLNPEQVPARRRSERPGRAPRMSDTSRSNKPPIEPESLGLACSRSLSCTDRSHQC